MAKLSDVAKMANVSAMTVSRVLNGKGYVSEDTRRRVLACIEELNYQPNLLARSLVLSRSATAGVLVSHIENPVYAQYVSGMAEYFRKNGMDIILYCADSWETCITGVRTLLAKQVDGIVIFPLEIYNADGTIGRNVGANRKIGEMIQAQNKPLVVVGDNKFTENDNRVCEDYAAGAELAVNYLVSRGHSAIGSLRLEIPGLDAGDEVCLWRERELSFRQAMRQHGLGQREDWLFKCESEDIQCAMQSTLSVLQTVKELPTAIFCANDKLAVGAMHALNSKGIRVPEDISIMGHDGSMYSRCTAPYLTTISVQPYETGRAAAKQLLDILDKTIVGNGNKLFIPQLLEKGGTVRAINGALG